MELKSNAMEFKSSTTGVVTEVKRVWWIKVKLKPVMTYSTDGAVFPHTAVIKYTVNGKDYIKKLYIPWRIVPPAKGAEVTVHYNEGRPRLCMVEFGTH